VRKRLPEKPVGALLVFLMIAIGLSGCGGASGSSGAAPAPPDNPPALPLRLVKGPYLQNVTLTSIVVMWETEAPATSEVRYGIDSTYGFVARGSNEVALHKITLENLEPGSRYHYAVHSVSGDQEGTSEDATFETAPPADEPFLVCVYGDSRWQPDVHEAVAAGIRDSIVEKGLPAIVLHVGDFISGGSDYASWGREFFDPARALMRDAVLFPARGNHDVYSPWYFALFSLPTGETWYSFDYGCAHIIALDTTRDYSSTSVQYAWLVKDLESGAAREAAWRFVFFHSPPYSSGGHGGAVSVQRDLVPLFEAYGVDMVLSGHDHLYERSVKDGIQYVVSGGGGASLYPVNTTKNPFQVLPASVYHHVLLVVRPSQVALEAKDLDGTVFDRVTLTR
jgi:acid phosphatase type 7